MSTQTAGYSVGASGWAKIPIALAPGPLYRHDHESGAGVQLSRVQPCPIAGASIAGSGSSGCQPSARTPLDAASRATARITEPCSRRTRAPTAEGYEVGGSLGGDFSGAGAHLRSVLDRHG